MSDEKRREKKNVDRKRVRSPTHGDAYFLVIFCGRTTRETVWISRRVLCRGYWSDRETEKERERDGPNVTTTVGKTHNVERRPRFT